MRCRRLIEVAGADRDVEAGTASRGGRLTRGEARRPEARGGEL